MKILAIETSTEICGVALFLDGQLEILSEELTPRAHARTLPEKFQSIFETERFKVQDLDAMAISIGPGSFTGLRIGLSFTKGIAYSHNLPIIPVPTLYGIAQGALDKTWDNCGVILHSHSTNLFYQDFTKIDERIFSDGNPKAFTYDALDNQSQKKIFHYNSSEFLTMDNTEEQRPSAQWIGELAQIHFDEWKLDDPKELVPEYISPFKPGSS